MLKHQLGDLQTDRQLDELGLAHRVELGKYLVHVGGGSGLDLRLIISHRH